MCSRDLFPGEFSVLVFVELCVESGGGVGWRPVGLALLEELEPVVSLHL